MNTGTVVDARNARVLLYTHVLRSIQVWSEYYIHHFGPTIDSNRTTISSVCFLSSFPHFFARVERNKCFECTNEPCSSIDHIHSRGNAVL